MRTLPNIVGLTLNYRDANRTLHCVRSMLEQGLESVLVWDNSEDGGKSAEELRIHFKDFPGVIIEISSVNLGFSAGVNQGMASIATRYPNSWVLLMNNDAYLLPNAVIALVSALRENPAGKVAYPNINHGGRVLGTMYYHRLTGLLSSNHLPGSFPYASGCCLLVAKERISLPLFDEDYFMYGEDWELGKQLGSESLLHVPQTLVIHEGSSSSGLGSPFYESRLVAAHIVLGVKQARNWLDWLALMVSRTAMLFSRAVVRSLRYRSMVPLRALYDGWRLAHGHDNLLQHARNDKRLSAG